MALNDDADKLNAAESYLMSYPAASQEFDAALDHLIWVYSHKPEQMHRCEQIVKNVIFRRRDEQHTMEKLRSFKL